MADQDPSDPKSGPLGMQVQTSNVETPVAPGLNNLWWIAGVLGGVMMIAMWALFANGSDPQADRNLVEIQIDAAAAQAHADSALLQGQLAGAQASVDIARGDAARSQVRAASGTPDMETAVRSPRSFEGTGAEGMNAESQARYDNLNPRGQAYVDEQMKKYDDLCARSSEC